MLSTRQSHLCWIYQTRGNKCNQSTKNDLPITKCNENDASYWLWINSLQIGDKVDIQETRSLQERGLWYIGTIKRIKKNITKCNIQLLIQHDGYDTEWDEWITIHHFGASLKTNKLTKVHTYTLLYHHNKTCEYKLLSKAASNNLIKCNSCSIKLCRCVPIDKCDQCIFQYENELMLKAIGDGINIYMNINGIHGFETYIMHIIHQYAVGLVVKCCNSFCNDTIIIDNLFGFDFDGLLYFVVRDEKSFKNDEIRNIYGCFIKLYCLKCSVSCQYQFNLRRECRLYGISGNYCYCSECYRSIKYRDLYICTLCNKYCCTDCNDRICESFVINPQQIIKRYHDGIGNQYNKRLVVINQNQKKEEEENKRNNECKQKENIMNIEDYNECNDEVNHIVNDIKFYNTSKWKRKNKRKTAVTYRNRAKYKNKCKILNDDLMNNNSSSLQPEFVQIDDYNYDYLQRFSNGQGISKKKAMKPTIITKQYAKKISKRSNVKKIKKRKKKKVARRLNNEHCEIVLKEIRYEKLVKRAEEEYREWVYEQVDLEYRKTVERMLELERYDEGRYEYEYDYIDDDEYYQREKQENQINIKLYAISKRETRIKAMDKTREKRLFRKNNKYRENYKNKDASLEQEFVEIDEYNYDYLQQFSNAQGISKKKAIKPRINNKKEMNRCRLYRKPRLNDKKANKKSLKKLFKRYYRMELEGDRFVDIDFNTSRKSLI